MNIKNWSDTEILNHKTDYISPYYKSATLMLYDGRTSRLKEEIKWIFLPRHSTKEDCNFEMPSQHIISAPWNMYILSARERKQNNQQLVTDKQLIQNTRVHPIIIWIQSKKKNKCNFIHERYVFHPINSWFSDKLPHFTISYHHATSQFADEASCWKLNFG